MFRSYSNLGGEHMLIGLNVTCGFDSGIHEIIRLFFPQCRVIYESTATDIQVNITVTEGPDKLELSGELHGMLEAQERDWICLGDQVTVKREVRRFTYGLLTRATLKEPSPYGILTGVRPTKLFTVIWTRAVPKVKYKGN
jgi:hypothetical protein